MQHYLDMLPALPPFSFLSLLILGGLALAILAAMFFRIVVPTNEVHIVQSAKRTVSYGKDQHDGNTYYRWPAWVPRLGVQTIVLPVSVFSITLTDYAAYDKDRLPFIIDIIGFFRINNSNDAAQRTASFPALEAQLKGILQGAIRSILASSEINAILEGRAEFGQKFTAEVDKQLEQWGVTAVKNIELMDIRDAANGQVIANIMAMKQSEVESKSRVTVAENMRSARTAEIEAGRAVHVSEQEAEQLVGVRTAEKNQQVGVAGEQSKQVVRDQEKITAEKTMEVTKVNSVRAAEIEASVQVVTAGQIKQTTILRAEGDLEATKRHAEGVLAQGTANAEAEKLMQMAPVQAQIALAEKIGTTPAYQAYLVDIRKADVSQVVGVEMAKALEKAGIKVIANAGSPIEGVQSVMDLLSSKGGTQLGAALEAFMQTDAGRGLVEAATQPKPKTEGPKA